MRFHIIGHQSLFGARAHKGENHHHPGFDRIFPVDLAHFIRGTMDLVTLESKPPGHCSEFGQRQTMSEVVTWGTALG